MWPCWGHTASLELGYYSGFQSRLYVLPVLFCAVPKDRVFPVPTSWNLMSLSQMPLLTPLYFFQMFFCTLCKTCTLGCFPYPMQAKENPVPIVVGIREHEHSLHTVFLVPIEPRHPIFYVLPAFQHLSHIATSWHTVSNILKSTYINAVVVDPPYLSPGTQLHYSPAASNCWILIGPYQLPRPPPPLSPGPDHVCKTIIFTLLQLPNNSNVFEEEPLFQIK